LGRGSIGSTLEPVELHPREALRGDRGDESLGAAEAASAKQPGMLATGRDRPTGAARARGTASLKPGQIRQAALAIGMLLDP
jgi:hypothetical protein